MLLIRVWSASGHDEWPSYLSHPWGKSLCFSFGEWPLSHCSVCGFAIQRISYSTKVPKGYLGHMTQNNQLDSPFRERIIKATQWQKIVEKQPLWRGCPVTLPGHSLYLWANPIPLKPPFMLRLTRVYVCCWKKRTQTGHGHHWSSVPSHADGVSTCDVSLKLAALKGY